MILVYILLAVIALALAISLFAYGKTFFVFPGRRGKAYALPGGEQYRKVKDRTHALYEEMRALPFEQVYITAQDGTKLAARYYHLRDGAPLQIQFHGYRGSSLRDFCGGHKLAREAGHNTLVVDQRAHGGSGSNTITFGIRERFDCLSWIKYAVERFGSDAPILLAGVSMGGATVLMAAGLELPGNVRGVIADCPYSSPEAIIRKVCRDMHLPPKLIFPFIRLGARLFGHFDPASASAAEAVRHAKIPILIIHGEDDRFVPCEMGAEIYRACAGRATFETFPDAGHGLSYVVDSGRYARIVNAFIDSCLR